MFQLHPSVLAAVALTIAVPASASAAVIVDNIYLDAAACVYSSTNACYSKTSTSSVWTSAGSVATTGGAAAVEHTSYVGTSQLGVTSFGATLSGSGTAATVAGDGAFSQASGHSLYMVTFSLTESYGYVLGGTFAGITTDLDTSHFTNYHFSLIHDTTNTAIASRYSSPNTAGLLALSGILAPGQYRLFSAVEGAALFGPDYGGGNGGTGSASSTFDLTLTPLAAATTPVPEPASMLLLSTGLLGAGVRRWRQRKV